MANKTVDINIRMDKELKEQADKLFEELGIDISAAFNIFVRQCLHDGCIPFKISLNKSNKETVKAMLEAKEIAKDKNVKGYDNVDKFFKDLD